MNDNCFIPFESTVVSALIPDQFNDPFGSMIPEICKIAARELQAYLIKNQENWQHNFGLNTNKKNAVKGKMFGVLVVQNLKKEIGYLSTFSGKLEDDPHPEIFVPSLFSMSVDDGFLTKGLVKLSEIGDQIKNLTKENNSDADLKIRALKNERKANSILLQQELFDQYQFLNKAGEAKHLLAIFEEFANKKPPAGAGECAAPKLLQYAYEREMKPLGIAEFWWGESTRSEDKKHKEFCPSCEDKCRPILSYMLCE